MHINFRRFLALAFIVLFFILLPLILNYTRGYRFDSQKNTMVRTGGITVDSKPRNAKVSLNGHYEEPNLLEKTLSPFKNIFGLRKMGGTTPAIFQNLLPDEYQVEVGKSEYQKWSKTINVYAEQVTFLENINLFLKNPEIKTIKNIKLDNVSLSPNGERLIYSEKTDDGKWEVSLVELKSANKKLIYKSRQPINDVVWSPDNSRIYFTEPEITFIDLGDINAPAYLKNFSFKGSKHNLNLASLKWSSQNNQLLYSQVKNIIYRINLVEKNIEIFHQFSYNTPETIADFLVYNDELWVIQTKQETAELKKYHPYPDYREAETSTTIAFIPNANRYQISDFSDGLMAISSQQNKNHFIIDTTKGSTEASIIAKFFANEFRWNQDRRRILYWDDYELGLINIDRYTEHAPSNQQVLSRYSQQISGAFWSEDENYIIFGLRNEIYALEIDNRDRRNIFKIFEPDSIIKLSLLDDNKLFLIGQVEDVTGIYRLEIQ